MHGCSPELSRRQVVPATLAGLGFEFYLWSKSTDNTSRGGESQLWSTLIPKELTKISRIEIL
jgi:hypothetical protein